MRCDDDKLYPNSDFIRALGKSKDEVREIVRKRLETVNFNKEVMEEKLQWGDFIFSIMCHEGSETEWAAKYDMSDKWTASNYALYVTTD